jgi:hypothetical protein
MSISPGRRWNCRRSARRRPSGRRRPATTIPGWNTYTIYGLSRFLYLLLGIIWLFAVMYYYGLLQEAQKPKKLWFYLRRITVVLLVLYAFSYAILWMLRGHP